MQKIVKTSSLVQVHNMSRNRMCYTKYGMHDIFKHKPNINVFSYRKFDQTLITDFNKRLSYELWENVFNENDVNNCFNKFLDTYLKLFNTCFPLLKAQYKHDNNAWLTKGIKISCYNKRKLYELQRDKNGPTLTTYYKTYCKTLTKVIKLAKQKYYNSLISCSSNKNKTIWNIINSSTNKKPFSQNITSISVEGKLTYNSKTIPDAFNPYPTAFPYGNGMVLHFYQQQESSTNKTVHKVINKGLKAYV